MNSDCKAFRAEIEERSGGAWLSGGARAHFAGCSACAVFFNEREALRRLVGELEPVAAPSDFEFRLRARMASANNARRAGLALPRFTPSLVSMALALIFVLSVTATVYFKSAPPKSQTAAQPSTPSQTLATLHPEAQPKMDTDKVFSAAPPIGEKRKLEATPSPRQRRRFMAQTPPAVNHELASATRGNSLESDLLRAPIITGSNVSVKVSAEPLRVVLRDESGVARRVAMKSVSFGAQSLVGRSRELSNSSGADNEGVW